MSNISISLNSETTACLDTLVAEGAGSNRSDVVRRAIKRFAEDEAVEAVLKAEQELREGKIIRGDIDALLA